MGIMECTDKKQPACKPGSVPCGKVLVIYLIPASPQGFSGLPSDVGRATLVNAGLHDLTTPKTYSPSCHHAAGGLLPHLLTLTPFPVGIVAVVFFYVTPPLQIAFC